MLQIIISVLTPFLAYLPAVRLGGTGVLATVVTGLVLGHTYLERFDPAVRLLWTSVWKTLGFVISSMLFLVVGLHFRMTMENISSIPLQELTLYGTAITLVVIVGRFVWVFPSAYLPRFFFKSIQKKDPYPPWQYPFIISWAGMRGGISLAAALAVPAFAMHNTNVRDLLVFLVFCVITATLLLQGLTLPWLLEKLGVDKMGLRESDDENLTEYSTKITMANAALKWLEDYKTQVKNDMHLEEAVKIQILEYQALKKRLEDIVKNYRSDYNPEKMDKRGSAIFLYRRIIEVERVTLSTLWHEGKISRRIRDKLLEQLDLRAKRYSH
jgi:CPA1 family monovalent cation:H+ antiporter